MSAVSGEFSTATIESLRRRFVAGVDLRGPVPKHRPELGPCEVWIRGKNRAGYGQIAVGSRDDGWSPRLAHRVAFLLANGRWPDPECLHKCDNPACVRIDHLFEGTQADNVTDQIAKGRLPRRKHRLGERHHQAKLTDAGVVEIRAAVSQGIETQRAIAKRLGVSESTVSLVVKRRIWGHVG